ncbi:MAG: phosphate signaling complex protein PhoU [Acidimicrobiia bacterium]
MAEEHRKTFHQQLVDVKTDIIHMAALAAETIPRATQALLVADLTVAQQLIDDDDIIDGRSIAIEEACLRLLALQQPMAGDLRSLVTAIKLNGEIERIADLASNIAKSVRRVFGATITPRIRGTVEKMSDEAFRLTRLAADAYADGDVGLASALDDMDDRLDALQVELLRNIIEAHENEGLALMTAVQLAMIGRYYERIGDHAVNMGERVQYLITGWLPEHTGVARAELRSRDDGAAPVAPAFVVPDYPPSE